MSTYVRNIFCFNRHQIFYRLAMALHRCRQVHHTIIFNVPLLFQTITLKQRCFEGFATNDVKTKLRISSVISMCCGVMLWMSSYFVNVSFEKAYMAYIVQQTIPYCLSKSGLLK